MSLLVLSLLEAGLQVAGWLEKDFSARIRIGQKAMKRHSGKNMQTVLTRQSAQIHLNHWNMSKLETITRTAQGNATKGNNLRKSTSLTAGTRLYTGY